MVKQGYLIIVPCQTPRHITPFFTCKSTLPQGGCVPPNPKQMECSSSKAVEAEGAGAEEKITRPRKQDEKPWGGGSDGKIMVDMFARERENVLDTFRDDHHCYWCACFWCWKVKVQWRSCRNPVSVLNLVGVGIGLIGGVVFRWGEELCGWYEKLVATWCVFAVWTRKFLRE